MCSLFGFTQYQGVISKANAKKLVRALAVEGMTRGTDATGYAYNHDGDTTVYKRAMPADCIQYNIPARVRAVLGHTRFTTQGSAVRNRNNHPFLGSVDTGKFAFAHNGVLRNDRVLRTQQGLPTTPIETDSYIYVQFLEKFGTIDFSTLKKAAELTKGAFVYTILDSQNNMWFVKGDNPFHIAHFQRKKIYVYASTQSMLEGAIKRSHLRDEEYDLIVPDEGDIIRIGCDGELTSAKFDVDDFSVYRNVSHFRGRGWAAQDLMGSGYQYDSRLYQDELANYMDSYDDDMLDDYFDILYSIAGANGFSEEDVDLMLNSGYSISEVEDMLQSDPFNFRICLMEVSGM